MPNNSDKNVLNAFMIWKKDGVNFRGWNWSKRTNVKEDMGVLDLEVSGAVSGVRNKVQWLERKEVELRPLWGWWNTVFQQHRRRLDTWTSPDAQHWNQIDYILCSQRWRSFIQSAKTRPGADCSSDHKLLIAKFRLKLKKVGKATRPFRYDLNQIPYDYTVEVRNRFKGLDLIERVPGRRFVTLYKRLGSRPSLWEGNAKKQNGCLGRPYK